jgi:hypothetical protein
MVHKQKIDLISYHHYHYHDYNDHHHILDRYCQ